MKLHDFINNQVTEATARVQDLGRALKSSTPTQVVETRKTSHTHVRKATHGVQDHVNDTAPDLTVQLRAYANDQLASVDKAAHKKLCNYD